MPNLDRRLLMAGSFGCTIATLYESGAIRKRPAEGGGARRRPRDFHGLRDNGDRDWRGCRGHYFRGNGGKFEALSLVRHGQIVETVKARAGEVGK